MKSETSLLDSLGQKLIRHKTFFRESGWVVLATTAGGVWMYFVDSVARRLTPSEYGMFYTLIQIVNLMGIPAIGLQSVFAQQTASAIDASHRRQLAASVRGVLLGIFILWAVAAGLVLAYQQPILDLLK